MIGAEQADSPGSHAHGQIKGPRIRPDMQAAPLQHRRQIPDAQGMIWKEKPRIADSTLVPADQVAPRADRTARMIRSWSDSDRKGCMGRLITSREARSASGKSSGRFPQSANTGCSCRHFG